METHDTASLLPIANSQPGTRWFCQYGCVVEVDGVNRVFVGDTLLGEYDPRDRDRGARNILRNPGGGQSWSQPIGVLPGQPCKIVAP
jgi:hypothetical protein